LKTFVALLRGINVSGQNKVSMADLRTLFLNLGAEDVRTYVQSGNVVFTSAAASSAELTRAIEMRIRRDLGLSVTVLLRTKAQLAKIVAGNPFVTRGRTKLNNAFFEKQLGVAATTRNWKTVTKLAELASA